jgi:hypothetical protein
MTARMAITTARENQAKRNVTDDAANARAHPE